NPVGAIFTIPMLVVMAVGPLLRWRQDRIDRIGKEIALFAALVLAALILTRLLADIALLPLLGLALGVGLAVASLMPLRGRKLARTPLATWGMVTAHFGIAVALIGMASESAFTSERLAAVEEGGSTSVGPWTVVLQGVEPVAGPNWTAIQGRVSASYDGDDPVVLTPQSRNFWAPPQQTTESALVTRWNGQLYAVVGDRSPDGRWQLRLWWKPFVTLIWYGGLLIALGGVLALVGRVLSDLRHRRLAARIADRRADREALA
ncbi:MAG: cytochrome c-type biogenesis CcmF C-terminal domain-containing protein, partial [Pseudomonadota bacterium]|nr:cytochrome c-type biogenesis CcmF C-terminal domain-containing protein [Pseudomonadota bacterium]